MRAVVQRVAQAQVTVDDQTVGSIGAGLCVLVGVTHDDTEATARKLASKLYRLRIFTDDAGKMNRSVANIEGQVLIVSQFTLYGDARKGNRPSFGQAAAPDHAEPLVDLLVAELRLLGCPVETGRFGADMSVALVNDGPVTLVLEI